MPAATTTTRKRKATSAAGPTAAASKKIRLAEEGADLVKRVLADASSSEEMIQLAEYARVLEEEVASLKPKPKTDAEIAVEVDKLRASVRSGIVKQMGVSDLKRIYAVTGTRVINHRVSGNHLASMAQRGGSTMGCATTR